MIELSLTSSLRADAARVWEHAIELDGVNYELAPLIKMTAPPGMGETRLDQLTLGDVSFRSILLAGRLIPIDLHSLCISEIGPGRRFSERSSSLLQASWEHERIVEEVGREGCTLTDRLRIEPRVSATTPIVARAVRLLFEHRHRRLVARFGLG